MRGVCWLPPVKGGEILPSLSDIMVSESDEELEALVCAVAGLI